MSSLVTSIFHISRSFIKRSLSDGNILCDNTGGPVSDCNVGKNNTSSELLPMQPLEDIREPSDSAPEISIEPNPCSRCSILVWKRIGGCWRTSDCPYYELTAFFSCSVQTIAHCLGDTQFQKSGRIIWEDWVILNCTLQTFLILICYHLQEILVRRKFMRGNTSVIYLYIQLHKFYPLDLATKGVNSRLRCYITHTIVFYFIFLEGTAVMVNGNKMFQTHLQVITHQFTHGCCQYWIDYIIQWTGTQWWGQSFPLFSF